MAPTDTASFICDVSDYNGDINPQALRNAGIIGLTSKIAEGGLDADIHWSFGKNINGAKAAGMAVYGGYYVVRTNTGVSVAGQAQHCVSLLDKYLPYWRNDPRFILQIDLEFWGYDNVPWDYGISFGRELLARAPTKAGKIFLYASEGQYGRRTTEFKQWNANYHDDAYGNPYTLYNSYGGNGSSSWYGTGYTFWQFTQHGQIAGYTGDVSAFRGDQKALEALIGINADDSWWRDDLDMHLDLKLHEPRVVANPSNSNGHKTWMMFQSDFGEGEVRIAYFSNSAGTWNKVDNIVVKSQSDIYGVLIDQDTRKVSILLTKWTPGTPWDTSVLGDSARPNVSVDLVPSVVPV